MGMFKYTDGTVLFTKHQHSHIDTDEPEISAQGSLQKALNLNGCLLLCKFLQHHSEEVLHILAMFLIIQGISSAGLCDKICYILLSCSLH
jgi:hypothetical protein